MSIKLFSSRLQTLRDPRKTLENVRQGNIIEIVALPSVSLKQTGLNSKLQNSWVSSPRTSTMNYTINHVREDPAKRTK